MDTHTKKSESAANERGVNCGKRFILMIASFSMLRYIILVNWTDQGIRNVKETSKRADAAISMAKKLGGKLDLYYTIGECDLVGVVKMPNDEAMLQLNIWLGALGNVRTRTMKAWAPQEFGKVVSKL